MDKDIDKILRHALSPDVEAPKALNDKILLKAKEKRYMGKKRIMTIAAAAVIACSATAVAAIKYLSPKEIAKKAEDTALTEAFESDDAVFVNETQEYGGYKVTFLGTVSGKGISDYISTHNGEVLDDRTYAITAIEKADGTPMPDSGDDNYGEQSFFVSPLIKGLNPVRFNAFTLNGGYTEFVQDGIMYRLAECDNVEMFADRGAYLCVSTSMAYDINAYSFDEKTGAITRNDSFDGLNALFELPLDTAKSDKAAAEKVIAEINDFWENGNGDTDDDMTDDPDATVKTFTISEDENGEIKLEEAK